MSENIMIYSQERHTKGKLCKKWGSVDGNYSTGRARTLISHIPSKATTFWRWSYLNFICRKCAESVKMGISEEYSFQHLSQNTTLIQAFRQLLFTTFVSSWYILLSGIKSFYVINKQVNYYWYFLRIQDRSSAHPISWRHHTSRSNSLKHL